MTVPFCPAPFCPSFAPVLNWRANDYWLKFPQRFAWTERECLLPPSRQERADCSLPGNARPRECAQLAGPGSELAPGDLAPAPGYGASKSSQEQHQPQKPAGKGWGPGALQPGQVAVLWGSSYSWWFLKPFPLIQTLREGWGREREFGIRCLHFSKE